jgi:hypothetical protein
MVSFRNVSNSFTNVDRHVWLLKDSILNKLYVRAV